MSRIEPINIAKWSISPNISGIDGTQEEENAKGIFGYNYSKAKVPYEELIKELYRMKKVLKAYETTSNTPYSEEEDY